MDYKNLYATALSKAAHSEIGVLKSKAEGDGFLSLAEGVPAAELDRKSTRLNSSHT